MKRRRLGHLRGAFWAAGRLVGTGHLRWCVRPGPLPLAQRQAHRSVAQHWVPVGGLQDVADVRAWQRVCSLCLATEGHRTGPGERAPSVRAECTGPVNHQAVWPTGRAKSKSDEWSESSRHGSFETPRDCGRVPGVSPEDQRCGARARRGPARWSCSCQELPWRSIPAAQLGSRQQQGWIHDKQGSGAGPRGPRSG